MQGTEAVYDRDGLFRLGTEENGQPRLRDVAVVN